jgi:hypothetical protein
MVVKKAKGRRGYRGPQRGQRTVGGNRGMLRKQRAFERIESLRGGRGPKRRQRAAA